jgi:hypothetical protein
MGQPIIQTSFASGELAPNLYGRVDLAKYHSAAALLQNFFVDYRGGATTSPGTKYVLQAKSNSVRLIPFQASFAVTYILEFGPGYIRFFTNGGPVLNAATTISAQSSASPNVFTDTAHGYVNGDWVFIAGNYYIVQNVTTNTFTLTDLFGNAINGAAPFSVPASPQRVYTIAAPYGANDLQLIKYAQNVNQLYLCHPNYAPQVLTLNSATNWTIAPINFVPTIAAPTGLTVAVAGTAGTMNVGYVVTAVDINGQESSPSTPVIATTANGTSSTQTVAWSSVTGAVSYNIYRSIYSFSALQGGIPYGFMGSVVGTHFQDTGQVAPNFAEGVPIVTNPFSGAGVSNLTLTANGSGYTSVPGVTFSGGTPSTPATAYCYLGAVSISLVQGGDYYAPQQGATLSAGNGVSVLVTSEFVNGAGRFTINGVKLVAAGQIVSGSVPSNPVILTGAGGLIVSSASINISWGVTQIFLSSPGAGYAGAPSVGFSGGGGSGAAATAALGAASAGNPTVPMMVQQRLFLGGQVNAPADFNMSQPGAPFNFNTSFPISPDSAINETLTSSSLHTIKSALPVSAGLAILTDKAAWLLNGGTAGAPISATDISANPQGYAGSGDVPPIATPNDILYVQAKNSIVRDLSYNFYLANYVGVDVSVISSHLFYGFQILQWAWAEEPFKLVWALRNDGTLLTFTFVKEQELLAWTHRITQGAYTSVATVNESTIIGNVDAVYVTAQRTVQGQTVTYIERMVELFYQNDYISSWQVDAGIGYNGAAATTFTGAQHLGGLAVTGLADGVVINFTMPTSGTFVFGPGGTAGLTGIASASVVTVGLGFTPILVTLPLDTGEPTIQGKRKKVTGVTLKIVNALGLSMGRSAATVQPLQDLVLNQVGSMTNLQVLGLVTGDARGYNDPLWDVPGQYTIIQPNPYPATILAVVPEIEVGDTAR